MDTEIKERPTKVRLRLVRVKLNRCDGCVAYTDRKFAKLCNGGECHPASSQDRHPRVWQIVREAPWTH